MKPHATLPTSLARALALAGLLGLAVTVGHAQMKVGSNPTTLASDTNLQVEASDGKQVVVRKSTAQVGIGTSSPANNLEVNSGSSNASGVRLTQLPSANLLGTNASGDIVKITSTSACTCGDIKASVASANHGDWQLMNGSYSAGSCGAPVVDARNAVLTMGGTLGTLSSATALAQSQLPNVSQTVTVAAVSAGTPSGSLSTNGSHVHVSWARNPDHNIGPYNKPGTSGGSFEVSGWNTDPAGDHTHTFTGNALATHTHSATVSSINPGAQSTMTVSNLPRVNINYFICIN